MPDAAKGAIPPAVIVEGPCRSMNRATVQFDCKARVWPAQVNLVARDPYVGLRRGQAVLAAQAQQSPLPGAARELRLGPVGLQHPGQASTAAPRGDPFERALEAVQIEEAQQLSLVDGILEARRYEYFGEVNESSGDARDRDRVDERPILFLEHSRTVNHDAATALRPRGAVTSIRGELVRLMPHIAAAER
jgi:hypothetical protein